MTVYLVGERMNLPERAGWCSLAATRWLKLAVRLGAFADARSRSKLASVGVSVTVTTSLNLTPPAPQGVKFDVVTATAVADELRSRLTDGDLVLACGARVLKAFGSRLSPWRDAGELDGALVAVPHPSGLNLWWNDAGRVSSLRRKMQEVLKCRG